LEARIRMIFRKRSYSSIGLAVLMAGAAFVVSCGPSLDTRLYGTWQSLKDPRVTYRILEDGRMLKHTKQSDKPTLTEVLTEDIEYSYDVLDENTIEMEPDTTFLTFWVCLFTECNSVVDYEFAGDDLVYLIRDGERSPYRRLST
jgi:hypothetical protein